MGCKRAVEKMKTLEKIIDDMKRIFYEKQSANSDKKLNAMVSILEARELHPKISTSDFAMVAYVFNDSVRQGWIH
jgi:hypothetical protein